ncbi:MAG TPA: hypothetical protein VF699_04085 [Caulobacteraceae bacterium]|jgi:hypothetical protein
MRGSSRIVAGAAVAALALNCGAAAAQMLEASAPVETLDSQLDTTRPCDPLKEEYVVDYVNGFLTSWKTCGRGGVAEVAEVLTAGPSRKLLKGWSGLVADAATLRLVVGPVRTGGELLSVQVRQAVAGALTTEVDVRTGLGGRKKVLTLPPGTPVYGLVREAVSDDRLAAMAPKYNWCAVQAGQAVCFPDFGRRRDTLKLGYGVQRSPADQSPLAPAAFGNEMLWAKSAPAQVQLAQAAFAAPMTLRVRVVGVTPERLELKAEVEDGGKIRTLRSATLRRNADGSATLPAFGGTIALAGAGDAVTASLASPPVADAVIRFLWAYDLN